MTALIARDQELATLVTLLRDPSVRLLTMTGPGGVGKTRLAIAAAGEVVGAFPDGAAFVNLAPIANADLVLNTVAGALGLRDMGAVLLHDRLSDVLLDKRLLLVLDNFEQVVTAGPQLRDLLGVCPGITLLITSRIRLRVSGEREFPVAPLPLDALATTEGAEGAGALQLFVERAQAVKPDFALTAETLPAISEIVRRVDGLPLAIELAAARVKSLPPAALQQRLEHRLPLLSGGARDLPLRQQTMRDTIGWSYELLTPAEQALFRRLSLFSGGFTLAAATAVVASDEDTTLELVTSLIEQSVLQQSPTSSDEPRFAMLETVREYARERLAADSEVDEIQRQHAAYFVETAEAAEGISSDGPGAGSPNGSFWALRQTLIGGRLAVWLNQMEADHDNLRAALVWLSQEGELEAFLRLSRSLALFWLFRGPYAEGRAWLERALAQDGDVALLLRREALYGLGLLAVNQDDVARAEACFSESLAISQAHDDLPGVAYGWIGLGLVAMHQRQFSQATTQLEEALAGARRLHTSALASVCAGIALSFQGASAYAQHAHPLATARFEAALREQRAIDDRWGISISLVGLGYAARDQGDDADAAALFAEGLILSSEVGDRRIIALALDGVAGIATAWGQPGRAACLFGAAAALRETSGLPVEPAFRAVYERDVAAARASLEEDALATGWSAGAALPLPVAIAEAVAVATAASGAVLESPAPNEAARLGLTPREIEVLRLLAEGLSDREIATALSISERTAGNHVQHAMQKIGVDSRTAAAVFSVRHNIG